MVLSKQLIDVPFGGLETKVDRCSDGFIPTNY